MSTQKTLDTVKSSRPSGCQQKCSTRTKVTIAYLFYSFYCRICWLRVGHTTRNRSIDLSTELLRVGRTGSSRPPHPEVSRVMYETGGYLATRPAPEQAWVQYNLRNGLVQTTGFTETGARSLKMVHFVDREPCVMFDQMPSVMIS